MIATGGQLLGGAAAPFTAGASVIVVPVAATGVATIVGTHGSVALVSSTERLGKGHSWDPSFNKPISNTLKKLIDKVPS
ncbi:hypothetical protein I6N95_15370 [Vagococcus sp. BWB3-3]|uniref:Uncharacterized protein n=1 Tax=Vagococcus allomyrinae TaxID=2794353 RepID=A0A940PCF3_9ENTE|nr:hypothetical protein [Vagococcus allomyrinae]